MPGYMVIPPDETEWSLAPEAFAGLMRERWPAARLGWVEDPERPAALDFAVDLGNRELTGRFTRDGQGLSLDDSEMEQLVEVALWFRDVVPADQPLVFVDEGNNADVMLETGMTVEQVASAYLADAWGDRVPGYIVAGPDQGEWTLELEVFAARMRERWPQGTVTGPADPERRVDFALPAGGAWLTGAFGGYGQVLDMQAAELEQLAEIALWFRDQVPARHRVDFIREGPDARRIAVEPGMTVERIAAAYREGSQG